MKWHPSIVNLLIMILLLCNVVSAQNGNNDRVIIESGDAPSTHWKGDGNFSNWQVLAAENSTLAGELSGNDTVDVFLIEIIANNGSIIELKNLINNSLNYQIQKINQTSWSIMDSIKEGEIILEKGIHAIRIEKLGQSEKILEYSFDIVNHGEVKIEDLSWMFKNFYFLAGLMLITPLLIVIYWNRKSIFRNNKKREIEFHEIQVLDGLKERFSREYEEKYRQDEMINYLFKNKDKGWNSIKDELGIADLAYNTEQIEIRCWKLTKKIEKILIGIIAKQDWDLAALQLFSPKGEEIKVLDINPDFIFEGDEVFLGKLESGKILILQLQIKSKIKTLSVNISGKVSGDSISGVINKYIENEEE